MKRLLHIFTALLIGFSFSSYAQFNSFAGQTGYQGYGMAGLGEQYGSTSGFAGVSCLCARQVAAGMGADANCEQNVKNMVDRVVQSNPALNSTLNGAPTVIQGGNQHPI